MNWTLLKSSLQLRRVSLAWYSLGLATYGWMMVAFFTMIGKNEAYQKMVDEFPKELLAAFGATDLQFSTIGGYLGIEYLSLIWVFIVAAAVIAFAAGVLGGAVEDGTMEVTLSQPVSRMSVAVTAYAAMAVYAVVLNLVTVATLYLPGLVHNVDVRLDAMALLFVAGLFLTMAVGSLAFMVSAMTTGRGRTTGIALGVMVAMYLANVLGTLTDKAAWLKDFSLFHYWLPNEIFDKLVLPADTLIVFGVATVVFFTVGVWAFMRRDVV
jgi:ABC-2 type transport system permease protein